MRPRIFLILFVLVLLPQVASAQRLTALRQSLEGQSVRINDFWSGYVEWVEPDALGLRQDDGQVLRLPLDRIQRVDVLERTSSGSGLLAGVLAGGAAGVMLASSFGDKDSRFLVVGASTALGAGLGSLGSRSTSVHTLYVDEFRAPQWDQRIQRRVIRVRALNGEQIEGRVHRATPDELLIKTKHGRYLALNQSEIAQVEVYRYRPELSLLGIVVGGGLGFFVGAGLGVAVYEMTSPNQDEYLGGLGEAVIGATIGTIAGTVMGFQMGNTWAPVPRASTLRDAPQISWSPTGPGGLGMTVSATF